MNEINFEKIKKIYFIGIKGSGMIAFVEMFHKQGIELVGSDVAEKFFTDETLQKLGIRYYEKFSQENLEKESDSDLIVYSTAYTKENNPEVEFAFQKGMRCLSYPELLGEVMKAKYSIAVCGTHGKTTTTAMLALAMRNAGADPSAIIGSRVKQLESNSMIGKSEYFIIEADEYQNKFSHYNPNAVILTNLDYDHPDYFSSFEEYLDVFKQFVKKIPAYGFLVVWGENQFTIEVAKEAKCRIVFYGAFQKEEIFRSKDSIPGEMTDNEAIESIKSNFFHLGMRNIEFVIAPSEYQLTLQVPGKHNRLNATAVLALCGQLGLETAKVEDSLKDYEGAARRFEVLGTYNGAFIVDDYAHHPNEVKATLAATREKYTQKNIICLFHPHTFSRTKALLYEFAESFDDADEIIILDIYGSAREKAGDVHSKDLVEAIKKHKENVHYIPSLEESYAYLEKRLKSDDVVITMGAGNVFEVAEKLAECDR